MHRRVALQLLLEGGESKWLDQVVHDPAVHRGPQTFHVARGGDGDHIDPRRAAFSDGAHHIQPRDVGQIDVEQDEIGLGLRDKSKRLGARPGLADDREPGYLFDVSSVERGHPEVVVDDQRADHGDATDTGFVKSGKLTVNKAPPWLTTVTSWPRRGAPCCTS